VSTESLRQPGHPKTPNTVSSQAFSHPTLRCISRLYLPIRRYDSGLTCRNVLDFVLRRDFPHNFPFTPPLPFFSTSRRERMLWSGSPRCFKFNCLLLESVHLRKQPPVWKAVLKGRQRFRSPLVSPLTRRHSPQMSAWIKWIPPCQVFLKVKRDKKASNRSLLEKKCHKRR
jgi:hypothetical protein